MSDNTLTAISPVDGRYHEKVKDLEHYFSEYALIKYRVMQGAKMLLEEPSSSISETAAYCGFDSPSNFSQHFRRFYSCTPREYRLRGRE